MAGHCQIYGNEQADAFAKKGGKPQLTEQKYVIPVSETCDLTLT